MKKLRLVNLGKGLNRDEMKQVNGGGPRSNSNDYGYTGTCKGVWIDCLCMSSTGKSFICKSCAPLINAGQC